MSVTRVEIQHKSAGEEFYLIYEDNRNFSDPIEVGNYKDDDIVKLYMDNDDQIEFTFETVKKYLTTDQKLVSDEIDRKDKEKLDKYFSGPLAVFPIALSDENSVIEMHYEDITEEEFFQFDPIKENFLNNKEQGLWAYHGLRKFRFTIDNNELKDALNSYEALKNRAKIVFDKKDNEVIEDPIIVQPIIVKSNGEGLEFFAYIDTNRMGQEFNNEDQRIQFNGNFQLEFEKESGKRCIINFPITIILHNTNYDPNKTLCVPLQKSVVSIDFGTSSTCVAVRNGKDIELLTLSSEKLSMEREDGANNQFENPTNVMIYRWKEIYKQWKRDNESFPLIVKGTKYEEINKEKKVEYDFGYTVKDVLEDVQNTELNAILTQIKLITYKLMQGEQLELNPYIKEDINVVKLVSSPDEEDEEHFDPVAFYGYLLGRVINNPSMGRIYTKFNITYPVKFNAEVRDRMLKSLEYGLKRSLPLPLREAKNKKGKSIFAIEMKYPEPVAYIGAMCGKYLKIEDEKAKLFAVYDFGGGTLDYSFGMFRSTEDGEEYAIDIYGVDGDENIGGENLISLISFWIYTSDENKYNMIENNIPFELPKNQKIPEDFPTRLINRSSIAKSNVRKLNEIFSRQLFENRTQESNIIEEVVLYDENNEDVTIEISVDYDYLRSLLTEIIERTVENFYQSMNLVFSNKLKEIESNGVKYSIDDVCIFKAGNSSRSVILGEKLEEKFPENEIKLIDEIEEAGVNKRYAITPKTAVAFGQIKLNEFEVNLEYGKENAPFKWYVGSINKGNGKFIPKINRNELSKEWVQLGILRSDSINLYYSGTPVINSEEDLFMERIIVDDDDEGMAVYIRSFDETSIEFCVEEKGQNLDSEIEVNMDNIIVLK